jgi:tRNA(Arg) A34 adenosine deaminase TadA
MGQAEQVIFNWQTQYWYHKKNATLRIDETGIIRSQGSPIAYIDDDYDSDDTFMCITMRNYKSQSSWKKHKKELAAAANKADMIVVFVEDINEFGIRTPLSNYMSIDEHCRKLMEVAEYSTDDVKTAVVAHTAKRILAYSFNQRISDDTKYLHAEQALCRYIKRPEILPEDVKARWCMLLEPCYDCLKSMLTEFDTDCVIFAISHKEKWNSAGYIELTNDLSAGSIRTSDGYRVGYGRWHNDKVEKWRKRHGMESI